MNVATLIKELKKMPQCAEVYNQDHDNSDYEVNGKTYSVNLVEKEYASDYDKDASGYKDRPDVWVTISV
jgi:hypothetical protein